LYSFYYDNGKRKTGEDLYIAEQLAIYHDTLYGGKDGKKIHFQKDRKAWLTALKKELLICGGQEALNVFGNEDFESLEEYIKESSTFNKSRWNTWNERNSKFQFISNGIEDEKGREGTLINDQIMREFGDDKPYYGPEE
jgi:Fe-S cluster biosynthesis and repair protein YggX